MNDKRSDKIARWPLIGLFGVVALTLVASGYSFYRQEAQTIRTEKLHDLKAIAELKVNQIVAWHNERLADARMNSSGILKVIVLQWLKAADDAALKATVLDRLGEFRQNENYQNIILAAPDGHLLLSTDPKLAQLEAEAKALASQALSSVQPVFGDFFRCPSCNQIHLDIAAPILDEAQRPVAVLILRTDPENLLYPLIQSWPLPSRSAETLLLRREGGDALFLNVLRHRADPALTLRIPLSRTDVPVVQAALGKTGTFEGLDYRGIKVLADLRPVPGTPWSMVAKVDADEILAEARYRGVVILLLVAMGVLMTGGLTAFVFSYRRKNLYKALFRAEWERRKAQEEIRATLYGIGDGVIATDAVGQVTRMNPVAASLTGWTEAEALGVPIDEVFRIVNEETRAVVENPAQRVLREGQVVGLANHTLLIAKDGAERPIADSGAPIHGDQGEIIGVVLVFRDQSAEQAAQKSLRESERRFRMLFERSPLGYQSLDADGCFIEVNPAWLAVLGYERDEVIGHWFGDFLAPDYVEAFRQRFPRFKEVGEVHNEFEMKRKDGSIIQVAFDGRIGYDEKGNFKQTHCILRDISAGKQLEALREAQREMLNTIFENAPYILILVNKEGRIANINRAGESFTGNSKDQIIGLLGGELFRCLNSFGGLGCGENTPCTQCPVRSRVMHTFQTGESLFAEEGQLTVQDRESRENTLALLISTSLVKVEKDEMVLISVVDITERKRVEQERQKLQEQLIQAQKMESVGRLAGGVAHDFNNMLGVILGHTEMVLEQVDSTAPMHDDLEEIQKAALRSADLTRQLLAFARKQTVVPKVLNLNETVSGMILMLRRLIGENIELSWKPGPALWPVKIDPSQVDQILANLSVNARDAIAGVGSLTIETANVVIDESYCAAHTGFTPGDYIQLAVSDTGSGMDKETMEHLFEPFFTTKDVGKGTGLGLATVYGAVRQNGGFINVYSEPGQGTTFKIYLPRAEAALAAVMAAAGEKPAHGTETVLLVEDEEAILKLGVSILKKHGYTVLAAETPAEALSLARRCEGPIHLLITDVVMPGMNGKELKDQLTVLRPGIKVLFMSGYTSDIIAHQGIIDEGVAFMQKPFSVSALAQKVRDLLQ